MVLILRVGGEYRGIGLVEFIWKVCVTIMKNRLWAVITLHDALHGLRQGREMGTVTMEAKLDEQIMGLCYELFLQVLLDVW